MKVQELAQHYPCLYHMAESGSWESIKRHGLLSTLALLDLFEIKGPMRQLILEKRRPDKNTIQHFIHGRAVIRDQKPMSESALVKCLQDGITPSQWFQILNRRVFFWLSEQKLNKLLSARAYRSEQHCVLTIDTAALLGMYSNSVSLSPINSGSTVYRPQARGLNTFKSIEEYPFDYWSKKRNGKDAVTELVVDYSVPNISKFVLTAVERKESKVLKTLFAR